MPARERTRSNGRTRDHGVVPILDARPGGVAQRFAASIEGRHPAAVFFAAVLAGYVVLASLAVLLGFLTDLSSLGSTLGGAPVLPILVGLIGIVCALMRKWRIASFAVLVLVVESATYRIASIIVPRDRPHVARLENLPADESYPSGHTAASLAVYCGLVLLLTSAFPSRRWRVAAWIVALLLPVLVAFSRMYRGMHHPLDVGAGALIGIGAVVVLLFACRAAGVAARALPGPARLPVPLAPSHPVVKLNKRDPQER